MQGTHDALGEALSRFISNSLKKVFLLKGKWGVGKSHRVSEFLKELQKKSPDFAYSYVSLFGLESIEEAISSIIANIKATSSTEKAMAVLWKKTLSVAQKTPYLKEWASILPAPREIFLRNMLVVFDDLERLHPSMDVGTVMGLISTLKERNGCRIILICHDTELEGNPKTAFEKFREKIVDQEFDYAPSLDQILPIAFPKGCPEIARQVFEQTETTNIRILLQVGWSLDQIQPFISAYPPWIQKLVLNHTAAFTVIRHQQPQIDLTRLDFWLMAPSKNSATADDARVERGTISRQLRFEPKPFDGPLIEMLKVGFLDKAMFETAIDLLKKSQLDGGVRAALESLWKTYNGNFIAKQEEVIIQFREFYKTYREKLGVEEIMTLARGLSMMGSKTEQTEWIDEWTSTVLPNLQTESIETIIQYARGTLPAELMRRLNERMHEKARNDPFSDIVKKMASRASWNDRDVAVLATIPSDAIEQWILSDKDPDLVGILKHASQMFHTDSNDERFRAFAVNLEAALRRISKRSALDEIRVTQYIAPHLRENSNPPAE